MHRSLRIAIGICALTMAAPASRAVVQLSGLGFSPRSGISMQITGYYDNLPKTGYVPLRITIHNDSPSSHEWTFRFVSQTGSRVRHEYLWSAAVDGRTEKAFELVVPLVSASNVHRAYSSLNIAVSGYGVTSGTAYYAANYKYTGNRHAPFTGISTTLAVASLGPLEQELTDRGVEFTGCRFEIEHLSPDWRAYLGFGTLWLTEQDWAQIRPAARAGLLDWISQGGRLLFCTRKAPSDPALTRLGLPDGSDTKRILGLGFVQVFSWDGVTLDPASAASAILSEEAFTHSRQLDEGYRSGWTLRRLFPEKGLNSPLIILAMIGFAVVVGPINLVVFAGKRRRHRLFLTTPIISIVASLCLVLIILIQDGIGGEGGRVAIKYLIPNANRELIIQEQVSRTGVLLASRYDLAETDHVALVNLDQAHDENRVRSLVRTDATGEGDWFSSRSVQAHYLSRISASRARIELLNPAAVRAGEEAPMLLSSLDQPLREIVFIDDRGGYWSAPALPVGVRTPLGEHTQTGFRRQWWDVHVSEAGLRAGGLTDRLAFRPGHVYGVMENPADGLIPTHDGIRWEHQHMIVVGPVLGQGGA